MKAKLDIWKHRYIFLKCRIYLIKNIQFGIASRLYAIEMKYTKNVHIEEINQILWNVLWTNKKYNIKKIFVH